VGPKSENSQANHLASFDLLNDDQQMLGSHDRTSRFDESHAGFEFR
jgi:hypothetical protein